MVAVLLLGIFIVVLSGSLESIGRYGLESHAHVIKNTHLSGGQKARVQFAMINIQKPHAIF